MTVEQARLGILVGGGPAPGINSAIGSATIEAVNSGLEVVGILNGFEYLVQSRTDMVRPLTIADVSRIHAQGGSILRTSRTNPTKDPKDVERTIKALRDLGIRYLVTIGGDDTALAAGEIAARSLGAVRVAHLPKTIDNDLPLPGGAPTFGFETARHVGTGVALNLMEESKTTERWCIAAVMGRKAGHLALGIGKATGATLTVIPEEFAAETVTLGDICSVVEGAILKRRALGRKDGLAIIAEGCIAKIDPQELAQNPDVRVSHDAYGNMRMEEIPLGRLLKRELERRFASRGESTSVVAVSVGYELRCAAPIPFDIDYTRTLGYGAVRQLLATDGDRGGGDGLVSLDDGHLRMVPFEDLLDPATGRPRTRMVDVQSEHYRVAREYMIRLERNDLENKHLLSKLAAAARVSDEEFARRFTPVVTLDNGA